METVKKYMRILLNIIIPVTVIALICFLGPKVIKFFIPFVIGWLIAMIANPLVRFLERRLSIVRQHSSALIVVVVLALIIGALYLIVSKLTMEIAEFTNDLPKLYDSLRLEISSIMQKFQHLFLLLPEDIQYYIYEFGNNLGAYISEAVQKIASPTVAAAGSMAKGIPNLLVNVVITVLSSYFFIAEQDQIVAAVKVYIPEENRKYFRFMREDLKHLVGGYFLAQFRIMFVVGIVLAIGFLILGVDYALLFAVLIAILDFLPLFGTGTALIPWAAIKLLSGEYAFAVGMLLLYVLTQVIRQVIQPKIVGDTMGLPPLLTLFFLYLGFKIKGIAGMILAVPIGLLVMNLYHYGAFSSLVENVKLLIQEINRFRKGEE